MTKIDLLIPTIEPIRRARLLTAFVLIGYAVIFGEVYNYINFTMWVILHVMIVVVIGGGLLWPALRQKQWPTTPLNGPLFALAIAMTISASTSAWPRLALDGLAPWLNHTLVFFLVIGLMRAGWADDLLRALMLVTGIIVLISFFELSAWYFGIPFVPRFSQGWWTIGGLSNPLPPTWHRLSFMLNNPVVLSAYLVLTIPVIATFLLSTKQPTDRILIGVFGAAALFILGATVSRGGWLGIITGLAVLTALWLWRNFKKMPARRKMKSLIQLGLVNFLAMAAVASFIWIKSGVRLASNTERLAYWQAAGQLFTENPVWGIGPGLFRWGWRQTPFAQQIPDKITTVHNLYLNHLAELGLVGGIIGTWLLVMTAITAARVLHHPRPSTRWWWRRAGCAAGLAGFLTQGFFETLPIWPIALPGIILTGYLLAPFPSEFSTQIPRRFKKVGLTVLVLAWTVSVMLTGYFAPSRFLAGQARSTLAAGNPAQAIAVINQSRRLDPQFALYQFETARWLADPAVGQYVESKNLYLTTLQQEPTYAVNYANLALVEWQLNQPRTAIKYMKQAAELRPRQAEFWFTLGYLAETNQSPDEARAAYIQTLLINPAWLTSHFWQDTAWRRENFEVIVDEVNKNLPPSERARYLFYLHLQTGNLTAAQTALDNLKIQDGDDYNYQMAAARLNLAKNNPETALAHIQQTLNLQDSTEALALQAEILLALNRLPDAENSARRVLFRSQNGEATAHFVIGQIRERQGLPAEAEKAYRQGLPARILPLDYAVALYRQVGDVRPLPGLKKTSSGPNNFKAALALVHLYRQQNRCDDAAQVIQYMLTEDPYLTDVQTELTIPCR
jgi:O-antigen ligase